MSDVFNSYIIERLTKRRLIVRKVSIDKKQLCNCCRYNELHTMAYECINTKEIICEKCKDVYLKMIECPHQERICLYQGCMTRFECTLENVIEYSVNKVLEDIKKNTCVNLKCDRIKEFLLIINDVKEEK